MNMIGRMTSRLVKSFCTRSGRIEWLGALIAMPFAASTLYLLALGIRAPNPVHEIQCYAGAIFAAGMALGIYGTAWAFAAAEPHHRLAAYSVVLEGMGCLALAVVIEHFLFHEIAWQPITIPAAIYLTGIALGALAGSQKRKAAGPAGSADAESS